MSESIVLTAVITPAQGKTGRVGQLLSDLTKYVHQNEPDTTRYNLHQETSPEGEPKFVVLETYKNEQALAEHRASEPYKNLFAAVEKEGLIAGPPVLCVCQPIAGFESRNEPLRQ